MPYAFHLLGKADGARVAIHDSIQADALAAPSSSSSAAAFSPEDVFELWCEPQAVFRVRGVGRCSATLSGHASPILCCAHSPTGKYAATGSGDATARIWDMETETPKHTLAGHRGWVLCVEWDAREKMLATGGHDGQIRLWDPVAGVATGAPLLGHSKWITSLAFEPLHLAQGATQRLASASKDGTVRIWNTSTRKLEVVLSGHAASVNVVRWGGENVIYTGSSDRTVKVWSGVDVSRRKRSLTCGYSLLTPLGQADPHAQRARALGQHDGAEYGLCPPHRAIRPHGQGAGRRRRGESPRARSIQGARGPSPRDADHWLRRPHALPLARTGFFFFHLDSYTQKAPRAPDGSPEAGQPRALLP